MSKSHAQVTQRVAKSKSTANQATKSGTSPSAVAAKAAKPAKHKAKEANAAPAKGPKPEKASKAKKPTQVAADKKAEGAKTASTKPIADKDQASVGKPSAKQAQSPSKEAPAAKAAPQTKAQSSSVQQPQQPATVKAVKTTETGENKVSATKTTPLPKAANGPTLVGSRPAADESTPVRKLSLAFSQPASQQVSGHVATGASHAGLEGPNRAFRDDPLLDKRIIEGMLDDKEGFLDDMHSEGFSRDAVIRRAAELGLSEALIRQVKGVAADLAGERPGKRPTPNSLGARTCLQCDRVFFSSGPGNRLCTRCRGGDAGLAQL